MRAIILITDSGRGGTPKRFSDVARGMSARGWEVMFVTVMPSGEVARELERDGVSIQSLNVNSLRSAISAPFQLRRLIRSWTPELVQTALWHANLVGRLAVWRTGVPIINGHESLEHHKPRWRTFADRITMKRAAVNVAVSRAVAELVIARDAVPPSSVEVIYSGTDVIGPPEPELRERVRDAWKVPRAATVVGWLGRMHEVKAVDDLLAAVSRVPEIWLVLGGDGVERSTLEAVADQLGLTERTVFLGEIGGPRGFMEAIDVFCLPSKEEGLPIALIEAMGMGLPVVATDVGGVSELITDGEDGLLVTPGAVEELAAAISTACRAPDLGRRAADTIRRGFTTQTMLDAFEQLWRRVCT